MELHPAGRWNAHRGSGASREVSLPERPQQIKGQKEAPAPAAWEMDLRNAQQDVQDQLKDVVSRLQSKNFFQSDLDIAFFVVFFIFIGTILLLLILVLIRCCCCCCCCCQDDDKPRRQKKGVVNMALEP